MAPKEGATTSFGSQASALARGRRDPVRLLIRLSGWREDAGPRRRGPAGIASLLGALDRRNELLYGVLGGHVRIEVVGDHVEELAAHGARHGHLMGHARQQGVLGYGRLQVGG